MNANSSPFPKANLVPVQHALYMIVTNEPKHNNHIILPWTCVVSVAKLLYKQIRYPEVLVLKFIKLYDTGARLELKPSETKT